MRTIIKGGKIVNEGHTVEGTIVIDDGIIKDILSADNNISSHGAPSLYPDAEEMIDATGCYVMPGIIDDHVHFREPGLTEKADIESETRAAAAGGVTSYMEMPNCIPQTTTIEALEDKYSRAAQTSHINYSFFFGATNSNSHLFSQLPEERIPGVKLFMGSSTGNMLVDNDDALEKIFSSCRLPLMIHCEDTAIINHNMEEAVKAWGEDPPVALHAMIRSEEACLASTQKAISLAKKYGVRAHIAHISTAEETELFQPGSMITAETCVGHLIFTQLDHKRLGSLIKVNPAIKTPVDQYMLRQALNDGRISVVATDHAPHLLSQKAGGARKASSGMPMIQYSLVTMLELVDEGVLTIEQMVKLMCHNPAKIFGVQQRGYLRKGYKADIVIVRPHQPWVVTSDTIESKCGWSPMEGHEYNWRIERTLCNGHSVYVDGIVDKHYIGQPLIFNHS